MNGILRMLLATGIVLFAALVTAGNCDVKLPPTGGTNTNTNNGGNGGNNSGGGGSTSCTGICPTTNLTLRLPIGQDQVKMSGNTIYVDASKISREAALPVHSGATDADRKFDAANNATIELFYIDYPGSTADSAIMMLVNRVHVTKDTIALRAGDAVRYSCSTGEMSEDTMASSTGGGVCRTHIVNDTEMHITSYLGTVFNNTKTTTHARGSMLCEQILSRNDGVLQRIDDTTAFNRNKSTLCYMTSLNNGLARTVIINDAWVDDTASTTEVELYAIGIDITGKTMPQWSDAAGYGRTAFMNAHDNAAVKGLLRKNKWGELKFKVKIVKESVFDSL